MTIIKISASCPYEIGDKIVTGREIHPPELAFRFPAAVRTITDIVCQYSAQTGEAVFLYELDGREPLVRRKHRRGRRNRNNNPPERGKFSKEV